MKGDRQKLHSMGLLVLILALILPAQTTVNAQATDQVIINEIMQNPSAVNDSAGEWFELYNPGEAAVDVDGWTIQDNDIDLHVIDNGGALLVPAGGYLVLGNNTDSSTNGGVTVDYAYPSDFYLSNSADELVLIDAAGNEIDRVEYDGGPVFPDPNGASMALQDPALDNNDGANWCTASTPYGDGDLGTPGVANDCPEPSSQTVINEFLADPASDLAGDANGDGIRDSSQDEFVEIVNTSAADLDISGWTLSDGYTVRHIFPGGTVIPANCAIVVFGGGTPTGSFGNVLVQTASSGSLGLNNSGDTITLNDGSSDVAQQAYGSEGGDNQSLTRDPDITGDFVKHSTAIGSGGALFSPGTLVDGSQFGGCPTCGNPATLIHEIQGSGAVSPLDGSPVTVEAVVVADFQAYGGLGGYFLQEEDTDADSDPATSEGIFVYNYSFDVNVGDVVRVTGTVDEYNDLTELTSVSATDICGSGASVTPASVSLPVASTTELESYEGMQVFLSQELIVSENYDLGRYGELVLSNGRLLNPTNVVDPGADAIAFQAANDLNRIILDDGSTWQNPDPIVYPWPELSALNTLRGGDTVQGIEGALTYAYGAYRVHPIAPPAFVATNPRTAAPDSVGGSLKVASLNVLNYFTTIDLIPNDYNDPTDDVCGPNENLDCRGADSDEELVRQRAKIVHAIANMDADIVGLVEIENHKTDDALYNLVDSVNAHAGTGTYAYVATGPIGTDAIKVALIYKPGTVSLAGSFAVLDSTVDPAFIDTKNRPVLAQTFRENATGAEFVVAVNHLKSKGSDCDDIGDPDTGDGQGNCNLTRTSAAEALVAWLAADPTGSGDPDYLIIGDLNAYAKEDPITAIKDVGYTDLIQAYTGAGAYSYVYFGQAGYLDHALANASLTGQVTGTTVWHINADEPHVLDYNTEYKNADQIVDLYNADPYRASDHDPAVVGLNLNAPPTCSTAAPSIDTLWPVNHKFVTVDVVGVTDPEGDPFAISIESIYQDEPVDGTDDGNTAPDGLIDGSQAQVRAERDGEGNGRVYDISFAASDAFGSCTGTVQVSAPISIKATAEGDGALYDSTVY